MEKKWLSHPDRKRSALLNRRDVPVRADPQAEFGVLNSGLTSCMPRLWTSERQVRRVFLPSRGEPLITCFDPSKKKKKKLSHP